MIGPTNPRAVRVNADGTLSLRPGVDFRRPGQVAPKPAIVPPLPVVVREYPAVPEFLRARLVVIQSSGEC